MPLLPSLHVRPDRCGILRAAGAVFLLFAVWPSLAQDMDSHDDLAVRDAQNKAFSERLMAQRNSHSQPVISKYNHVITYGQSLASAAEGWPALSTAPGYDNLMVGDSVRSGASSGGAFKPVGGAAFRPIKAVVQQHLKAMVILDDEDVAKLEKHDQEEGESVDVGALNMARKLYLQKHGVHADPDVLFVASNAATSGRSLAQLAKNGEFDEYKRVTGAVHHAKRLADAEGAGYSVSAFFWLQGEFDYSHTHGGVNDKGHYKTLMRQLRNDLNADTAVAIADQQQMPAFLSYQTDAKSSTVDGSLAVGMAQWELAQEEPGWYMVGPVYPYVDNGTHLTANGYRWFGQMLGKVYHRVVVERLNWQPLAPRHATVEKRDIFLDFHVPHPPLAFGRPYLAHKASEIENKGFLVYDDEGSVPIAQVEIAADTVVRLRAKRDLAGRPRVTYASYQVGGAGNLRDSDPTIADSTYEYLPDAGMPRDANIAALVGEPYPLQNWSIAFDIVVPTAGLNQL